jgi:hypothetical protein
MIEGVAFALTCVAVVMQSRQSDRLRELSLVAITAATGMLYYLVIPAMALTAGRVEFLGMEMPGFADSGGLYLAALLYLVGAIIGVKVGGSARGTVLRADSIVSRLESRLSVEYFVLLFIALGAVAFLVATGQLALFGGEVSWTLGNDNLLFLTQAYNVLIVLSLVYFVHDKGGAKGVVVVVAVAMLLVMVGFRFRLVLLCVGALTCFVLLGGRRPSLWLLGAGGAFGVAALNVFGAIRSYGRGLNFGALQRDDANLVSLALDPGGEIGPFLVAHQAVLSEQYAASIGIDPWVIGVARLIPTAMWPQKPSAYYLTYSWDGFNYVEVATSGIAPPQLAEFFWQFGWFGLVPLSFVAFFLAAGIQRKMRSWRSVHGVVGVSLVPVFFGFYMQSRGYFSQIFTDAIVMFGSLAFLQLTDRLRSRRTPR